MRNKLEWMNGIQKTLNYSYSSRKIKIKIHAFIKLNLEGINIRFNTYKAWSTTQWIQVKSPAHCAFVDIVSLDQFVHNRIWFECKVCPTPISSFVAKEKTFHAYLTYAIISFGKFHKHKCRKRRRTTPYSLVKLKKVVEGCVRRGVENVRGCDAEAARNLLLIWSIWTVVRMLDT